MGKANEAFTAAVQKEIAQLKQGDPFNENTTTGPIARIDLAENLEHQMRNALIAGAQLTLGGDRHGCNFTPALLVNVKKA